MKMKHKKGTLKLNNNVLFVLVILLILINSYTFVLSSKDVITGLAERADGTTRVCIGTLPEMTQPTPLFPVVLNDTYNSSVQANSTELVRFYYFYFGIGETLFGVDYDADNDTMFNATLDVPSLPDGNCNYRISARSAGFCNVIDAKGSAVFTVNNIDVEPKWDKFKNAASTNFSNYTSWASIPNGRIAEPDYGMIEFTNMNFDDADLDWMFNISYNFITLNVSVDYNCFDDVDYRLTFFNVTQFAEPIVLKNGAPCSTYYCSQFNYSLGNYSFITRAANEYAYFSIAEGGTLSMNYTFRNKTYDNSPTLNFSTYMRGSIQNIPIAATCYYKTDYAPTEYTIAQVTGSINQSIQLPEQNWSRLPTNMGHYPEIQHNQYYSGLHGLHLNCTVGYQDRQDNTTFLLTYTQRDRVFYSDRDTVKLYLFLEEPGLNLSVNLSQIDSNFDPANVTVINTGLDYNISYNISATNTRPDGQYNLTIEAFNATGEETMNGSIFIYLHNNWRRSDIDDAFDCWSFKQGYYFDEVACDWESDVNLVVKQTVDPFFIEFSCFDGIDNDFDGEIDNGDIDCAGIYYLVRRFAGIDSAFMGDPCFNNVCRVCVGDADTNDDGICDTTNGVNVRYLNKVRPGQTLRVKFNKAYISNLSVRLSVNYLNDSFNVQDSTSGIEQLPRKELGGCVAGQNCKSVTATTFGPGLPDTFAGTLNERMNITISPSSYIGQHPYLAAGKSIAGSSAFQNMIFFEVRSNAIINESDNATYCFDGEDNDLNDQYDCFDISCNLTSNPAAPNQRCEVPNEITCNDSYDNDRDGYADCEDNDCFQKNGTTGPCYAMENFNSSSCADKLNNDFDWGYRCDPNTNVSYQTRQTNGSYSGTIRMTDCLDIDCNNSVGNTTLNARCEYCNEKTCNDNFDNDVDTQYDCTGNAYRNQYERDCDRWHDLTITCPTNEINCSDNYDNDLDSDSLNGEYNWLGIPVYGGWNCIDLDCNGLPGNSEGDLCQWRNETICDDNFDNDGDSLVDCSDPGSCKGISGTALNLTGLCRPCAEIENISIDACRDGDDNDYDSATDCADINCSGKPGPGTITCGLTETNCTDGIDNDYDLRIDNNDSDCVSYTVYDDEFGPGQCNDGIDNDLDGDTDCGDTDCENTMRCLLGSYNNACTSIGYVGAIDVSRTRFVVAGKNFTTCFRRNPLNVASVMLLTGNSTYSIRSIAPVLDSNTTFMTGSTTNFVKVNGTHGLMAQNNIGFNGNLNLNLSSTTATGITPGTYRITVATSVPGIYGESSMTTYIAENELPNITNISIIIGNILTGPGTVNVTFTVNTTDNGTYNSGIAFCAMNLSGVFSLNSNSCSYTTSLGPGTYNFSAIAYDGALNPSNLSWQNFTVTISTVPMQTGGFYNPYPAENYPDRQFFNDTEKLNIGVNFEGGTGFDTNETGCIVEIMNKTETLSTQYVNLSVVGGEAHCNGQVELGVLFNRSNSTSPFPSAVYYFTVSVYDNSTNRGISTVEDFNFCYYYYDNSSSKYRCRDQCQLQGLLNNPPVLILDIPNQTWPRGTKLSVIDLDDYFMDPDNDPLTFTWTIDNARINVSIDSNNLVTFSPDQTFYGLAYITFYAHDPFSSTPSNLVTLEVLFTPLPPSPVVPSGGGGGGGGGTNFTAKIPMCEEDWTCSDWGPCLPSGYQTRTCRDKNECGKNDNMPETMRECVYNPTCRDRIKNQGETAIDCGGPCPPCPSCTDRILNQREEKAAQAMGADPNALSDCGGPFCPACPRCDDNTQNQGETGIDCGGPCGSCATCNDRIRNQGEVNIDCGGPCPSCRVKIIERAFNWNLLLLILSSLFLLLLILLSLLFGVFKKKFIRLKAKLLNYYMRLMRMFEKKKMVERELPIMRWMDTHLDAVGAEIEPKGPEHCVNEIDKLVRIFFKRVFLIRYAFTNEELVKDLEKHHIPVVLRKASELLFEELAQIKYGGETVDKDGVRTLASQVRVLTERIVNEIETKKKTKINISERDINKIGETLEGADKLGVEEAIKRIDKGK